MTALYTYCCCAHSTPEPHPCNSKTQHSIAIVLLQVQEMAEANIRKFTGIEKRDIRNQIDKDKDGSVSIDELAVWPQARGTQGLGLDLCLPFLSLQTIAHTLGAH